MVDGSGTINPAALNTPGNPSLLHSLPVAPMSFGSHRCDQIAARPSSSLRLELPSLSHPMPSAEYHADPSRFAANLLPAASSLTSQPTPRGRKRSRSPEQGVGGSLGDDRKYSLQILRTHHRFWPPRRAWWQWRRHSGMSADLAPKADNQRVKKPRGRPSGVAGVGEASSAPVSTGQPQSETLKTLKSEQVSQDHPAVTTHNPAPKANAGKPPVIKALPTVRDHTTDQLTPEGDEYIPREHDQDGETKVNPMGHPLDGREYKMRTFYVPNRGEKLFMLATECARVLGYRDSYLLFNKNRSLYKIIATQSEKDELIHQEILPYSYRSRQIAIVTAKSMFRQFGARVINEGRRVRDDYWESKARKQGFTEDDMAGDKRPGATKARDAAALNAAGNEQAGSLVHQDIDYRDAALPPELGGPLPPPNHHIPIPMIQTDARDYGSVPRQRQDISGTPYQDRTQPSSGPDIMHQANNAAELSKAISAQRKFRGDAYRDTWNRKIDPHVPTAQQKLEQSPTMNQSPQMHSSGMMNASQSQSMLHHGVPPLVSPQRYQQPAQHQNPHVQSPVRQSMPNPARPDLQPPQRSSIYNPSQQAASQTSPYGYSHSQQPLWGHPPPQPPPQSHPQQSPVSSHHSSLSQQYSPSSQQQQLHHPAQSPHHPPQHAPSQMHNVGSHGNLYGAMGGMPGGGAGYGGMSQPRSMYNQASGQGASGSPNPQQQGYPQQTMGGQQGNMQGWAPPPTGTSGQGWGGYPSSSGF